VRVSEGGTKSFVLTHGVRRQRETLGRVGVVSLQQARSEAKRRLAEYTLGKTQSPSITWAAAQERYLADVGRRCKPRTLEDYTYALQKHFRFGETKLSDLRQHDFDRKLDKLSDRPSEHSHAFAVLRSFLRWAFRKSLIDANPMERMQSPHRYRPRERILTDEELKRVWKAAEGMETFGSIVCLLILTGQRIGEVSKLTGEMIEADYITLPASLTKNSREHRFPIGPLARSILSTRQPQHSKLPIFPARGAACTPFNGFSKSKEKLDRLSGVTGWTLHDLRRTFASGVAAQGVSLPVVEKLLNHISGSFAGIVAVYQRYNYAKEMREAVGLWEMHVRTLLAG
jgi:integrase